MKPAFFRIGAHFLVACFGLAGYAAGLSTTSSWAEDGAKSGSGQFSASDLPADRDGAAILTVPAAGRYSVRAKSASGARIDIVDMIEGPGEFWERRASATVASIGC